MNIGEISFTTSLNFLANTFFSMDMAELRSEKASELKELVWGLMEEAGSPNVADFYPLLKLVDPQGFRVRMTAYMKRFYRIFDELIDARIKARGEMVCAAEEKDVLDALINMAHDDGTRFHLHDIRHLLLVSLITCFNR